MSKLRNKLDFLYNKEAAPAASDLPREEKSNTRLRLERLVESKLRRSAPPVSTPVRQNGKESTIRINTVLYPLNKAIGPIDLSFWSEIEGQSFDVLFPGNRVMGAGPYRKPLFIDTETTGLSGGTGTLPFMIGSGFFDDQGFTVRVMTLLDPGDERRFLEEWIRLIDEIQPDCLVSFNGRAYDLPLLESRFILNRLPYTLDRLVHLDFLYPARTLWGWTFPSRRLGILGETLLGLSREGDIAGEFIPGLYFDFLRHGRFAMLEPVVHHNALDIVGLAALITLAASYLQNGDMVCREGEHLGLARLWQRRGDWERAETCLERELAGCSSEGIRAECLRRLAICKKRRKRYDEAASLWKALLPSLDKRAFNELIVHTAFREGDMEGSMELIREALEKLSLTGLQRQRLEARLARIVQKSRTLSGDLDSRGAEQENP